MVTGQLWVSLLVAQRPKKSYFSSACEYVKLPFSLKVPKKLFQHPSKNFNRLNN
jgi:hypothetical protein